MIYGNWIYHRTDDQTDLVGLRTLVLSRGWQPSRDDLSQEEIDEEEPNAPGVPGGLLLIGSQTRPNGGVLRTSWTFEGIRGDGKGPTFRTRANTLDYRFDPGMSQISLKKWKSKSDTDFKTFDQLLNGYQGYLDPDSDQIIWPIRLSKSASARGLSGNAAGTGDVNPMYGEQDWWRSEGTYRVRYLAVELPRNLRDHVGKVTSDIPGRPQFYDNRNYMKLEPMWRRRGYIHEIVESYWLSGDGGWPVPLYGGSAGGGKGIQIDNQGLTAGIL